MENPLYKIRGGKKNKKKALNKNIEQTAEENQSAKKREVKFEAKQAEASPEINPMPIQGAKKWGKKPTVAVTHIDTLNNFDDDEECIPQKIEKHQPPPKPVYEEPKESKFISDDVRLKLFGKDEWKNKDKDNRKNQQKGKYKNNEKGSSLNNSKFNRTQVPVNAINIVSNRKNSSASNNSFEKPLIKSFTPEGEEYDYEKLCEFEPRLKSVMIETKVPEEISKHKFTLDWKNKMTRYYLNKAILHHDYNLEYFELPEDEGLVPTVPSRREYIHWIHDLISNYNHSDGEVPSLYGIDIGVGASAIYPLLGVKEYGWKFIGSDICEESLKIAGDIVSKNSLSESIELKLQENPKKIFSGVIPLSGAEYEFDFCMCNPPFFTSSIDRNERRSVKAVHSRKEEDVTEGGEIGFLCRMVKESCEYRNRIKWFTAFIGRKMDFVFLCKYLETMLDDQFVYTLFSLNITLIILKYILNKHNNLTNKR